MHTARARPFHDENQAAYVLMHCKNNFKLSKNLFREECSNHLSKFMLLYNKWLKNFYRVVKLFSFFAFSLQIYISAPQSLDTC